MQSINTVDLQKLNQMRTRSISKHHFQYRYVVFFEITRDYYATSASVSLSLSLSHSHGFQSLQIVWIQKTSDVLPNQIRGKQAYQELIYIVSERPMPRKIISDIGFEPMYDTLGTFISQRKAKIQTSTYHKSSFSCMQCAVSCSSSLKLLFFFHANL